jgi:hypothetical protein
MAHSRDGGRPSWRPVILCGHDRGGTRTCTDDAPAGAATRRRGRRVERPLGIGAPTVGGFGLSTAFSNSAFGTLATRSAVLRWCPDIPALAAAFDRLALGGRPPVAEFPRSRPRAVGRRRRCSTPMRRSVDPSLSRCRGTQWTLRSGVSSSAAACRPQSKCRDRKAMRRERAPHASPLTSIFSNSAAAD